MSPRELERFRTMERAFDAALDQPPGAGREAVIRGLCGGDPGVCAEVALLLEEHERIRAVVATPAERLPRFGAWQAVELLGRGGMGTVYLAERADGAFRMSAAVKVVPLALASPEIEERFRRERQFLASLDHARIARLIDGGVSKAGLPYLVMELVPGVTIDRYCEMHRLDARGSVQLVRQVMEALIYVHECHLLHRDVKPSNILVDEKGGVKLLDFGMARLVDATAEASLTRTGVSLSPRATPVPSRYGATHSRSLPISTRWVPCSIAWSPGGCPIAPPVRQRPARTHRWTPSFGRHCQEPWPAATGRPPRWTPIWNAISKTVGARRAPKWRAGAFAAVALFAAAGALMWLGWRLPGGISEPVPFDAGVPNAMQPALSADGCWLAFASPGRDDTRPDVWLKRMPAGAPRKVTEGLAVNDEPALSPDGRRLAFHSTRQPDGIYLQAAGGGEPRLLAAGGREPRFSPDGASADRILYTNAAGDEGLKEFYFKPAGRGSRYAAAGRYPGVCGCSMSARGTVLADEAATTCGSWFLPADVEAGKPRGPLTAIIAPHPGRCVVQTTSDGGSFLQTGNDGRPAIFGDFVSGARRPVAGWFLLGSDGQFVLEEHRIEGEVTPQLFCQVRNLATGERWGWIRFGGVPWDLSRGGRWVLTSNPDAHRVIKVRDSRSACNRPCTHIPRRTSTWQASRRTGGG